MEGLPLTSTAAQVQSRTFRDIDELNQAARGWQVDFRQLDRGPFECRLVQIADAATLLTSASFDRRIDQQGAAPPAAFTFGVPRVEGPRIVWRSRKVPPGSLIVYRPGSEIDAASRPGFEVLTLTIAVPVFEAACARAGRPDLVEAAHTLELVVPSPDALDRFVTAMQLTAQLFSQTARPGHSPDARLDLPATLVPLAIEALASARPAPARRAHPRRSRVIRRALDVLAESHGEPVTVSALCEAAGVSERTLQYAFRERFDVTPKRYITAHHMHRVRARLRDSDPDSTRVVDIANAHGFWHMGQFARDYRRQFGELPSETVKRNTNR